ncbi:MAG: ABC transporter permease [Christensenellales bacterium]
MLKYLLKRIIASVLTLFILITVTFFLMHVVPGGPFNYEKSTPVVKANMEKKYGLDKPLTEQYRIYLDNLTKGDLGDSIQKKGRSVNDIIAEKFPFSAKLGLLAISFSLLIGIPLGAYAAIKHESLYDRIIMLFTTVFISVPGFVLGTLLLIVFGVLLGWAPTTWVDTPVNYILPVITYSFYPICYITKLTRSSMLETLGQDYIMTARAKGLSKFKVNFKHALRNSVISVISYLGPLIAFLITGGFAVEKIFSVPGLGSFFVQSVSGRDYPVIMGTTIFLGALIILMNLIVDFVYSYIDPRIKLR